MQINLMIAKCVSVAENILRLRVLTLKTVNIDKNVDLMFEKYASRFLISSKLLLRNNKLQILIKDFLIV